MIRRGAFAQLLATACVIAGGAAASAQNAPKSEDLTAIPAVPKTYKPKKTEWGEPDLSGLWPIDHLNMTPFQRTAAQGNRVWLTDEEYAARQKQIDAATGRYDQEAKDNKLGMGAWMEAGKANRRTSFLIDPADGRLPAKTPEGERRSKLMRSSYRPNQEFDWTTDFDSWDRCISRGLPASMFTINYNNGIRLWQAPGLVAIQLEMVHETRIIPTDGRPGVPRQIHNWLGESRGHWENGNTLVVETTNFKPGPSATNVGTWGSPPWNDTPVSTEAKMTERFTMTGPDTIVYEVTWNDPTVFTAPWTARLDWRRKSDYQFFEYACWEGDVQIRGYISSSRAQRAKDEAKNGAKAQ
jgi:hypothetical protein